MAAHLVPPSGYAATAATAASVRSRRVPAPQPVRVALPPALHLDAPEMPCGGKEGPSLRHCLAVAVVAGAATGPKLQWPPASGVTSDLLIILRTRPVSTLWVAGVPTLAQRGKPALSLLQPELWGQCAPEQPAYWEGRQPTW